MLLIKEKINSARNILLEENLYYQKGVGSFSNILNTQLNLQNLEKERVLKHKSLLEARVELSLALGDNILIQENYE